ncbi:NUDIX hydrolase [Candidatus Woesearchaeota archaeon]|jgi:8-oxo-dGTP pyrophosphatase MutT (NUDIX family)|nr:NUDIX hydrolase [Candidatus Woesearchaeota archaeon]
MVHLLTKVGEYGIIIDKENKQFLMVQWGEYYKHKWHFPGGRIDEKEKEKEGLIRELKEEVDVEVKNIKPVYAKYIGDEYMTTPKDEPRFALFYLCELKENQTITLKDKGLISFKWFKKSDLSEIDFWMPFYKEILEEVLPF